MPDLADVFDRTGTVKRPPYRRLIGETWSLLSYHPSFPDASHLAKGDGHVVLLIPAFLTGDFVTASLRRFLNHCGYRSYGWGLGLNVGPTRQRMDGLRDRLADMCGIEGGPVSLIGVSLGGLLARDLAYDRPQDVRRLITVASPTRLPTASTIEPLLRLCARLYPPAIDFSRLATPLPVPSTAIFTKDDGVVAWESCRTEGEGCAVEVGGPHLTICRNPDVLLAIADQLSRIR